MDWDRVEANWKQFKGKVKTRWGKLTDEQLDMIAGKRPKLAGRIRDVYGVTEDEAERQIRSFEKIQQVLSLSTSHLPQPVVVFRDYARKLHL